MTITPAYINEKLIELLIENPGKIPGWINDINFPGELSHSSDDAKKYLQFVKNLFAPQPYSPFPVELNESTLVYWEEINSIVGDYLALRNYHDLNSIIESYLNSKNWNEKLKILENHSNIFLSNYFDYFLRNFGRKQTNEQSRIFFSVQRGFLKRCKMYGIELAIREQQGLISPKITLEDYIKILTLLNTDVNSNFLENFPDLLIPIQYVLSKQQQDEMVLNQLRTLPSNMIFNLSCLSLWRTDYFDIHLMEFLGFGEEVQESLGISNLFIRLIDEDNEPWFALPEYILNFLSSTLSNGLIIDGHKIIARFVRKRILGFHDEIAQVPLSLELIKKNDGSPINIDQEDIIETSFALKFILEVINNSDHTEIKKMLIGIVIWWHHHLFESKDYWTAVKIAYIIREPLIIWGRTEEYDQIFEKTILEAVVAGNQDPELWDLVESLFGEIKSGPNDRFVLENAVPSDLLIQAQKALDDDKLGDAIQYALKIVEIVQEPLDINLLISAYMILTKAHFWLREHSLALEYNYLAEELASQISDKVSLVEIKLLRGKIIGTTPYSKLSIKVLQEGLEIAKELDHKPLIADASKILGGSYMLQGNNQSSEKMLLNALKIYEEYQAGSEIQSVSMILGMLYSNISEKEKSQYHLKKAKELLEHFPNEHVEKTLNTYRIDEDVPLS